VPLRHRPAAARRLAMLLTIVSLAGCGSPREKCQQENPGNPAGFESCWQAVLQRQNARLNEEAAEESKLGR
jgi:hypothetical protein